MHNTIKVPETLSEPFSSSASFSIGAHEYADAFFLKAISISAAFSMLLNSRTKYIEHENMPEYVIAIAACGIVE